MRSKLIFFCILVYPTLIWSQEKLNSLIAPTSPASSILGLQPTTVLSPKSYQTLETAMFSNFINNSRPAIPNDFALEFTPYWARNHGLSLEEYLDPKIGVKQFIRNSSFSLASTQNFILGDSTSTNGLAFGYRTTFYFSNKSDREKIKQFEAISDRKDWIYNKIGIKAENLGDDTNIKNKADFLKEIKSTIMDAFRKYEDEEESKRLTDIILLDSKSLPELDKTEISVFVEGFRNLVDKTLKGVLLFNEYETYIRERQGLEIDIAFANLLNFPTNSFENSYLPRQSFWITPTYRFKDKLTFLKVLGVLRYEWYNLDYYKKYFPDVNIYKNNFDFGFALSSEFEKASIQFELVGRNSNSEIPSGTDNNGNELFRKEHKSDFQYIGTFNYNLTDQLIISYNIGNRFDPIQNQDNTLVSTLTLNFGFGTPKMANNK
jgi:hypothetical protein